MKRENLFIAGLCLAGQCILASNILGQELEDANKNKDPSVLQNSNMTNPAPSVSSSTQGDMKDSMSAQNSSQQENPSNTSSEELVSKNGGSSNQDSEDADSSVQERATLNRSVVTATGFKQDIKDAPASISVIPSEEILERPMRDLGDVVQNVPGVDVEATKTGDTQISMRGLSSNYTLILIDGRRQNVNTAFHANGFNGFQTGMMPPPSMIERIEVLRGPASVVWGSEAMGGVINIITKKHVNELTGSLMLESGFNQHNLSIESQAQARKHGSWGNMHGINGSFALPIVKNILSLQINGAYRSTGANEIFSPVPPNTSSGGRGGGGGRSSGGNQVGPGNPYSSHSPSAYTNKSVGARLNFTPNKYNVFSLSGDFNDRDTGTLNTSLNSIAAYNTFRKSNVVLSHDFNSEKIDVSTYFQYMNTQRIPHKSSGIHRIAEPDTFILDRSRARLNENYIFDTRVHKGLDLGSFGFMNFNGGFYYMYETYKDRSSNNLRGLSYQNQYALYLEDEYTINDYIALSLGARYNYSDVYTGRVNPRLYVNISPTSWWVIKMGITSGMMIPSINTLNYGLISVNSNSEASYGNVDLQAEKSWNYELSTIFDTRFGFISLAGFYNDYVDKVASITYSQNQAMQGGSVCDYSVCTQYQNVDRSKVMGFESSYELNLERIGFNINYTYTDSKQLSGKNYGYRVNTVPLHSLNTRFTYKFTKNFSAYLRVQFKANKPISTSNSGRTPTARMLYGYWYNPYSVVDLGLNYKVTRNVILSAMINNLFDTNFAAYDVLGNQYTNKYGIYLPGRNLWVALKMNF